MNAADDRAFERWVEAIDTRLTAAEHALARVCKDLAVAVSDVGHMTDTFKAFRTALYAAAATILAAAALVVILGAHP